MKTISLPRPLAFLQPDYPRQALVGWILVLASFVAAMVLALSTLSTHVVFPRSSFPIFFAVPVLAAAVRLSPRGVAIVAISALVTDALGIEIAKDWTNMALLATVSVAAVGGLAIIASRQRASIDGLSARSQLQTRQITTYADRLMSLYDVIAALSHAFDEESIATIILDQGLKALDVQGGILAAKSPDGCDLILTFAQGYAREVVEKYQRLPIDAELPIAEAARTGKAVFLPTMYDVKKHFPAHYFGTLERHRRALDEGGAAALPLTVDGQIYGAIGLSFATRQEFTANDRRFMLSLAQQAAQAFHRVELFRAESEARARAESSRDRLAFLADASRTLHASLEYQETLKSVATSMVPRIADWSQVFILDDEARPRLIADAIADPAKVEFIRALEAKYPITRSVLAAPAIAIQNRTALVLSDFTDDEMVRITLDPEHLRLMRAVGARSYVAAPLIARERVLGAIVAFTAESGRRYGIEDRLLLEQLAERAAIAIDNARLYAAERESRQKAESAVRLRDEFIAVASHELNTPLTNLRGYAQLELLRLRRDGIVSGDAVGRALTVFDRQSARLANLVSRLFDAAALDTGRIRLRYENVDVSALVEAVARKFETSLEGHQLIISPTPPAWASVDRGRVEQVLTNLLDNAIRYSPDGGDVEVSVTVPDESFVEIAVRDHGPGIIPERRTRLFERYFQADPENSRSGLGLGLYVSEKLIALHGGDLRAEFPFDGGTRVVVRLPVEAVRSPSGN